MVYYSIDTDVRAKTYAAMMAVAIVIQSWVNEFFDFLRQDFAHVDISAVSAFTIFGALFYVYDRFIWRKTLGPFRLSPVPNFSGMWVGYIIQRKEFSPAGDNVYKEKITQFVAVDLYIKQTFRQISIRLRSIPVHGRARESECTTAGLFIQDFERPKLTYTWSRSDLSGAGTLFKTADDGLPALDGFYESNFPRIGLLKFRYRRSDEKWCCGKVVEIKSREGRPYLGIHVDESFLMSCLDQMSNLLSPETINQYREHQRARDGDGHHLTILDPNEYATCRWAVNSHVNETSLWMRLLGLGRVNAGNGDVFYAVMDCEIANSLRQSAGLGNRDMHVTLGFNNDDLHNVPKGATTLISQA